MVNPENILAYLKKYRGWCGWKYEERKHRLTKVPYNPLTGTHASVNQPDTFADFNSAMKVGLDDAEEELRRMEECRKAQAEVEKNGIKPVSQKMVKAI